MKTSPQRRSPKKKESRDHELFEQLAKGDYEALLQLHQKFYRPLCRFGARFETNHPIVEEKVADIFIELWSRRDLLSRVEHPIAYLYVMARNRLLRTQKQEVPLSRIQDNIRYSQGEESSREDEMIRQEEIQLLRKRISKVLMKVPKRSRRVFEMSRIEGFKYKEIAEILGISYRTVEQHVAITMKTIKNNLIE